MSIPAGPLSFRVTLLLASLCGSSFSQSMNTGTFLGSVADVSGAAVPGAVVRVTSGSTSFARETVTDSEGNYQILQVPAGEYRLEFEKQGFQRQVLPKLEISAGQS